MEKKIAIASSNFYIDKGKTYWVAKSDYYSNFYHVYASDNRDSWLCNISEENFRRYFGD